MLIRRNSPVTGEPREREIDVTEEQLARWKGGELIQKAMPHLSSAEREFIISGTTDEEWDEMWKEGPE